MLTVLRFKRSVVNKPWLPFLIETENNGGSFRNNVITEISIKTFLCSASLFLLQNFAALYSVTCHDYYLIFSFLIFHSCITYTITHAIFDSKFDFRFRSETKSNFWMTLTTNQR